METAAKGRQWEADVREKTGGIGFQSISLRKKRAGERERRFGAPDLEGKGAAACRFDFRAKKKSTLRCGLFGARGWRGGTWWGGGSGPAWL